MGAFPASSWRGRRRALARAYELFPGVRDRAGQRARTLSGGERRLTALARGLMRQSRIMLIDEPSLGLAPVAIDTVYGVIGELKSASTTILLVEENFTHVGGIADTVHIVEMGVIVRSGSFDELSRDPTVVGTYLGSL
jgi:branched-chain amino acid transport system ATP-binding protein